MKERPIVVLGRIRPIVVLDRILTAVSAKWIRREREAIDADGKSGSHHFGGRHHKGKRPTLFSLSSAAGSGSPGEVEAEDESKQEGKSEGLNA